MILQELIELAENEIAMLTKVLPDEVREAAQRCTVSYEDVPTDEDDLEDDVLGVFEGASMLEDSEPHAMPHIRLFLENIWEMADEDEQDYLDEVGTTYLHELGHYLGWDEDEIAERGLE
jgi:predicted Zn-dependent protease with MMP-like domain